MRLFGNEHEMLFVTRAHPTMVSQEFLGMAAIYTSNGFCFCQDAVQCKVPKGQWASTCGLDSVISSLLDRQERPVVTLNSQTCTQQIDWPFLAGTLRDGSEVDARTTDPACNIMDRLPVFKYSYRSLNITKNPSGKTTLDAGGVCHMGRAANRIVDPAGQVKISRCRTIHRNSTHVTVRCTMDQNNVDQDFIQERKVPATPAILLNNMRNVRRRCTGGQCSAPPAFYDDVGNNPLRNEVSYGLPFKWSPSRLMAAQIKKAACGGNHNATQACDTLLNLPEWEIDKFITNMFQTPLALFNGDWASSDAVPSLLDATVAVERPREDLLWSSDHAAWVLCDQKNKTCYGSISKEEWTGPNKLGACKREMAQHEGKAGTIAVGLNICDLDDRLNNMCLALQTARQHLIDANCQMTGACSPREFVYTPSMYSTTNSDFARGTVTDFYELHNPQLQGMY